MTNKAKQHEEALLQTLRQVEERAVVPPGEHERQAALAEAPPLPAELLPGRITIAQVREHPHVRPFLDAANQNLKLLGYTEHGLRHAGLVGAIAANVLSRLSYPARQAELAAIAGLLH